MNATKTAARVDLYTLVSAKTGRVIRKATKVIFADGREVKFLDRLPKGEAVRQAEMVVARGVRAPGC